MEYTTTSPWRCCLELRSDRSVSSGSFKELCDAIRRGADLRVYTEWRHEEHVAPFKGQPDPGNEGLLREIIDFRQTLLIDDRHAAGITLLRQPIEPACGFNGAQPRMSFFLYNMDGHQCNATLSLDSTPTSGEVGRRTVVPTPPYIPKMSPEEHFDVGTHAPSRNFIYDMEVYRYWVCDNWIEIFAHDREGRVAFGSFESVEQAILEGRELKAAIHDLNGNLGEGPSHEVFTYLGSGWVHARLRRYESLSHPILRIAPAIPLQFASRNWDLSWVFLRTDGFAVVRTLDPYSRVFRDWETRLACRWFVR